MKKVSKKVKFLAAVLGSLLISSSAFAVDLTLDDSAVKRATAGQFSTDSDKVNAKDIFDLERSFFSAGYLGSLSSDGNGTTSAKNLGNGIQGSFGVALPAGMYLGIAAAYNLNDSAGVSKDNNGDYVHGGEIYKIGSTGNFMAALRINEMIAVHYNLKLSARNATTGLDGIFFVSPQIDKAANTDYKYYRNNAIWTHEIAAAVKFGEHKLTIPVIIDVHANNQKYKGKEQGIDINGKDYGTVDTTDTSDYVRLNINPEFFLSLPVGPMTGINMGLNFGVGLNNNVGKNGTFAEMDAGTGTYVKNEYKTTKKALRMNVGVWASFPMEWSLANDQVSLAMEPQIKLDFDVNNFGEYKQTKNGVVVEATHNKSKNNSLLITPYAELPIGTLWRPVEWYELRFGTALVIGSYITLAGGEDGNGQKIADTTTYETYSGIAGFFGMGFIVGEDFNVDLYAEVAKLNFFSMDFGGQLTYRF